MSHDGQYGQYGQYGQPGQQGQQWPQWQYGPQGIPPEYAISQQRPPMPLSVRRALACLMAGAGLTVLQMIVMVIEAGRPGDAGTHSYFINGGLFVTFAGGAAPTGATAFLAVGGVLTCAAWIWMHAICRRGRNWGRIVSTVLFGFGTLALGNLTREGMSGYAQVSSVVIQLVGLLAIILLWSGQSGPYFRKPAVMVGGWPMPPRW